MARIILDASIDKADFLAFRKIADIFPEIRAEMLGYVGNEGKKLLFNTFFSGAGAELHYKNSMMLDRKGRRTVGYSIAKRAEAVKISSYPANLFEKGRKLRSGRQEPGKFIITRKFKTVMDSALGKILNNYDVMYLQKKFDRVA